MIRTKINLHQYKAATAAFLLHEDIALVQEPWLKNGEICGPNAEGIRACILAKNHLNIFILSDCSDEDSIAVACEAVEFPLWISSTYMTYDQVGALPGTLVRRMIRLSSARSTSTILGADANVHHHIWGSSETNDRDMYCTWKFIVLRI